MSEHEKERSLASKLLTIFALVSLAVILAALLVPGFIRARSRGGMTACKSNLKNIGTALEMYSTDNIRYPRNLHALTPDYLKQLPLCPAVDENTYYYATGPGLVYNTRNFEDYYIVSCEESHHEAVNTPAGFPQYDGLRGLYER